MDTTNVRLKFTEPRQIGNGDITKINIINEGNYVTIPARRCLSYGVLERDRGYDAYSIQLILDESTIQTFEFIISQCESHLGRPLSRFLFRRRDKYTTIYVKLRSFSNLYEGGVEIDPVRYVGKRCDVEGTLVVEGVFVDNNVNLRVRIGDAELRQSKFTASTKSLPTRRELDKIARDRGFCCRDTQGKCKEELAEFLGVELIYNPGYGERAPRQRPDNDTLRSLASAGRCRCDGYYGCRCNETTVRDTTTGEEFKFHARKHADDALGTKSEKVLESWGLSVKEYRPQTYSYVPPREGWDGSARQAVYEAIRFGVGFRD